METQLVSLKQGPVVDESVNQWAEWQILVGRVMELSKESFEGCWEK